MDSFSINAHGLENKNNPRMVKHKCNTSKLTIITNTQAYILLDKEIKHKITCPIKDQNIIRMRVAL